VGEQVYEGLSMRAVARWPAPGTPASVALVVNHGGPVLVEQVSAGTQLVRVLAGYEGEQGAVEIGGGYPIPGTVAEDRSSVDRPLEFEVSASRVASVALLSAAWASIAASEVIAWVAEQAGLATDLRLGTDPQFSRYSVSGGMMGVLADLAESTESQWTIEGPTLRMWPQGDAYRPTADLWSPNTGLISVSGEGAEIRAQALLRPSLRPGDVVRIVDAGYAGDLRVLEALHEIDTYGATWYTSIVGVPRG
jgi:hypothetical protein